MDLSRQLGLISPEILESASVTLIGIGGIGSPTALTLAKMGIGRLKIFDDDVVAPHNLPNQLFRLSDIKRAKVDAGREILESFTGVQVETVMGKYDGSVKLEGIVVSAVDSMTTRIMLWEKIRYNIHVPLYVEARMAGEMLKVYTLDPNDPDMVSRYEKTLYTSEEAVHQVCTEKSIIYTVMITAGFIAGQVKKWLVGEPNTFEIIGDLKNMIFMLE